MTGLVSEIVTKIVRGKSWLSNGLAKKKFHSFDMFRILEKKGIELNF